GGMAAMRNRGTGYRRDRRAVRHRASDLHRSRAASGSHGAGADHLMPRRLTYTPKIGAEICTMIAEGVGLKAACEKLGLNRNTVRGWIDDRVEFGSAYDKARRHRADH